MAIMASGVGFSIRAGILGQWAEQYGFTQTELGAITGGGLTGFGIIILLSALIADKIGYGKLMVTAFVMHLASAALTLATGPAFASGGKPAAFQCLFWGMFLFAVGNGIAEAVVNPLVATLFPNEPDPLPEHPPRRLAGRAWSSAACSRSSSPARASSAGSRWTRPSPGSTRSRSSSSRWPLYGLMMLGQQLPQVGGEPAGRLLPEHAPRAGHARRRRSSASCSACSSTAT